MQKEFNSRVEVRPQADGVARYWIGVASRDHVLLAARGGYAQLCHGKEGPARRLRRGDWVVYYSSKETRDGSKPCQRFTAVGQVTDDVPKQVEQAPNFCPFRRDVAYRPCVEADIRPLIQRLSFIKNKERWGMAFRYGFIEASKADFKLIYGQMVPTN